MKINTFLLPTAVYTDYSVDCVEELFEIIDITAKTIIADMYVSTSNIHPRCKNIIAFNELDTQLRIELK